MIQISDLSKTFRVYKKEAGLAGSLKSFVKRSYTVNAAVKDFSLNIKKGEFVGLLGPNGAGKTTLMKMLTGIIAPSSGQIKVLGQEPFQRSKDFRRKIALVMGQKSQLWWDIPAMDSLLLLQKYYEISDVDFKFRVTELAELMQVQDKLEVHVRKLSLGERMKMEIMASLLHRPEVIFLDEPTIGLDLVAQKNIRAFLREYHQANNTTVILTSHYMADVSALCERIVLILAGQKRFDGPIDEFSSILGQDKFVSFVFSDEVSTADEIWRHLDARWSQENRKVELRIPELKLREYGQKILANYPVVDFFSEKMPIERVLNTLMESPELLPPMRAKVNAQS